MVEEIGCDTASRAGATILGAEIGSGSGGLLIAIGNPREIREARKPVEVRDGFETLGRYFGVQGKVRGGTEPKAEIVGSSADTLKIGVEIATQAETKCFGSKTQEIGVENVAQINGRREIWTVVGLVCAKMSLGVTVSFRMQIFHGEDSGGWIFRSERYFELNNFSESEKLMEARVSMKGDTLAWFQGEDARRPFQSWVDFKSQVVKRFLSTQERATYEKFLAIRQEGTVAEFRHQFEVMAARL